MKICYRDKMTIYRDFNHKRLGTTGPRPTWTQDLDNWYLVRIPWR